ncbi:hypothetical protein AB835_08570 [Candidatus Endobugula sertula]|uniref:Uncharacterized protein n=1 Tax=Candidatus Endobugula sertula TaxID=62101 RepID=A0A1D2QPG8_9GAMM|nr:hypothetical protein AB835_08570 [Candidatus Endobugula sertula]
MLHVSKGEAWKHDNSCSIGIRALEDNSGFAPDGSHYYTSTITGTDPKRRRSYVKFEETIERVRKRTGGFQRAGRANKELLLIVAKMLQKIQSQGIKVVAFLPPVAPPVIDVMTDSRSLYQWNNYRYIKDIVDGLAREGYKVHNLFDSTEYGSGTCEFVDGIHGGDVTYARILRAMVANGEKSLREFINLPYIDSVIKKYQGLAMIPDARVTTQKEVDFLELDCKKMEY